MAEGRGDAGRVEELSQILERVATFTEGSGMTRCIFAQVSQSGRDFTTYRWGLIPSLTPLDLASSGLTQTL